MDPLKIAFFTTFYPPYHFGGDAIGIERLVRALARRGCEITVIHNVDAFKALNGPAPEAEPKTDTNIRIVKMESGAPALSTLLTHQLGRPALYERIIDKTLAEGDFDIIWHNNASLIGAPATLKKGDALKIYEAHEHWLVCPTHVLWRYGRERCDEKKCLSCILSYKRPPQLWRMAGAFEGGLKAIDLFIAKSAFSRDKHAEFGFRHAMSVIPYFLPDAPLSSAKSPRPQERPYFLFVGRLEKIKGLQDVFPAFEKFDGADLIVVGAGEYEEELKAKAKDNPRIRFTGRLAPDDIAQYYEHAEALIVPSICYETFGIIIIEAFRQGTPVIARRLGPFPEIIESAGGGLLFETPADLAAALAEIATKPARRDELSMNARRGFEKYWREDVVVDQYFGVLAEAAEARGDAKLLNKLERR
ncbi:MAG: glycosyltransferase family 4 protein [Parvularculaceae bacterium]|nr:glycosyltransferase family 4 protein [Parvularculaceae bacterium]